MTINYKTYKKPTDYLKLPQGTTPIRIISEGDLSPRHKAKMKGRFMELGICTGVGCKICSEYPDNLPKDSYRWIALNRSDCLVGVLEAGSGWGADLVLLIQENGGDPTQFDILVTKAGKDRDTKYTLVVSPESQPFTESEKSIIKVRKPVLVRKYLTVQ